MISKSRRRSAIFDIETSNLDADYGIILTWCILDESTGEIIEATINKRDLNRSNHGDEDRRIVKLLIAALRDFDVVITYYGKRFDAPYIRTRAVAMGLDFPVFGTIKHVDVYDMVKHRFKLSRNGLDNACRTLLGRSGKTRVAGDLWRAGSRGDVSALGEILEHNRFDVTDLRDLYVKVREYSRKHEVSI